MTGEGGSNSRVQRDVAVGVQGMGSGDGVGNLGLLHLYSGLGFGDRL